MILIASAYFITLTITTIIALIIQFLSIYLILNYSPKNMTRYKPYLMLSTIYDIIYTFVIGILLQGSPTGPENDPTILFTGLIIWFFQVEGARIGVILFYSSFALVATGQTICLLYRYLVFHTKRQNIFHFIFAKRRIRIIHFLIYLFVLLIGISGSMGVTLSTQETEFNMVGVYMDTRNRKTDTMKFVILCIILLALWELSYFGIVARIMQLMRPKIAIFSPNTIRLHRQLTYLLLAQAISPLICLFVPVALAGLDRLISDKCFGYPRIQASFLMSTAQMAINSLLTIGFISPFRSKMKKILWKWLVCLRIRAKTGDQSQGAIMSITNSNNHSQTI